MNCLKRLKNEFKPFLKLKNEFGVSIDNNYINLYLKRGYNNLNNFKHIKFENGNLIIDLTDINDKNINLYIGNTLINNKKVKDIKILCNNISVYLEDYNTIECDNLYVKTNGKIRLNSIDVKNDVVIIADAIESQIGLSVNSNNQNYIAKKASIKYGFLDASNTIRLNVKDIEFFSSGIFSKELFIDSDNVSLSHIINFEADSLTINSNIVIGNNSTIVAKYADITSNDCKDLNIVSDQLKQKNKVKIKI